MAALLPYAPLPFIQVFKIANKWNTYYHEQETQLLLTDWACVHKVTTVSRWLPPPRRQLHDQCCLSLCLQCRITAHFMCVSDWAYQSEELVNFWWWSDPGYGFRITFRLPSPVRNRDFRRFISISHTVTDRFSRHSAKWLMSIRQWIHNILIAIRQTFESESGLIRKYWFES